MALGDQVPDFVAVQFGDWRNDVDVAE